MLYRYQDDRYTDVWLADHTEEEEEGSLQSMTWYLSQSKCKQRHQTHTTNRFITLVQPHYMAMDHGSGNIDVESRKVS